MLRKIMAMVAMMGALAVLAAPDVANAEGFRGHEARGWHGRRVERGEWERGRHHWVEARWQRPYSWGPRYVYRWPACERYYW
jgi:hypothetical protein